MKINCSFHKFIVCFLLAACALCAFQTAFADDKLRVEEWPQDGFPLLASKDANAIDSIWDDAFYRGGRSTFEPFDDAVYFQLKNQGKKYKGKLLRVKGRLLRAVFVPTGNALGYYDLWVLLPDSKRDPIRVIAKNAPEDFTTDEKLENAKPYAKDLKYREETFEAFAVYYRATAYDAGDDVYAAPTLVAYDFSIDGKEPKKTFSQFQEQEEQPVEPQKSAAPLVYKLALLLALLPIWFFVRRFVQSWRNLARTAQKKTDAEPLPDKLDKFSILLAAAIALTASSAKADEPLSDAEFWGTAVGATSDEWTQVSNETRDGLYGRSREIALTGLSRLSGLLSISVLKERGSYKFKNETLGGYASKSKRDAFFSLDSSETVGYFLGTTVMFEEIPLNEIEKENSGFERLYRTTIELDSNQPLVVYSPQIPQFDAPKYLTKTTYSPLNQRVAGYALAFGKESSGENVEPCPVVLAPKLAWLPTDAPLCAAGLDAASYESAPVFPHDALEKTTDPQERKRIARALRWTTDDVAPFYETLAAVKRMPKNADKRKPLHDVVELFNRPEQNQCRPTKILGWARRVNTVLIDDPDVVAATGLERYYQLFVYTSESQGNPIALCVPELPEGLAPGGGKGYSPTVEFFGYFYKTWAYKTSDTQADQNDELEEPQTSWTRAPLLVGRIVRAQVDEPTPQSPISPRAIFTTFIILACAWIVLRRTSGKLKR